MALNQTIIDDIKKRRSVRTFNETSLDSVAYEQINAYIATEDNLTGPLGKKATLQVVPVLKNITDKGVKVGTYGFITRPKGYIIGVTEKNKDAIVDFGYVFEKMILFLTRMNIGTCWLGGTFSRNTFEKEIELSGSEIIPCITPIGYADKQRFVEAAMRFAVKSDDRKPWKDLFFYSNFNTPLKEVDAGNLATPIEMVRLAPSASNKQPWRIVLSEDKKNAHIYLEHTPNYSDGKMGFDMQCIDIGIAMSHFELACKESGVEGHWTVKNPNIPEPNTYMEYMVTWEA